MSKTCGNSDCNKEIPEHRKYCSQSCSGKGSMKKKWNDPEFIRRHKEWSSETMTMLHCDPEFSARQSERSTKWMKKLNELKWSDPEYVKRHKENTSKQLKKQWRDPELRKIYSDLSALRMKKRSVEWWKDPEYRQEQVRRSSEVSSSLAKDPNCNWGKPRGNPQVYNGIRFKSSWEVRLATQLDVLGIDYQYEFKTFKLWDGIHRYTPDFYLPQLNLVIEIKPSCFIDEYVEMKINCIKYYGYGTVILDENNWDEFITICTYYAKMEDLQPRIVSSDVILEELTV